MRNKFVAVVLLALVLACGAAAQVPACTSDTAPTATPSTLDLFVGTVEFNAGYDYSGTPACSTTVTTSCISGINIRRDGALLASCAVPASFTGLRGNVLAVTLIAPLKNIVVYATASYRDGTGALAESGASPQIIVTLRPASPGQLNKRGGS
jgi:hypothetical protein